LRDFFGERLERADPDEYLFTANGSSKPILRTDVYQYFRDTLRRCGLLRRDSSGRGYQIHVHSLRKFFKTRLEAAGVNPLLIERWMGHTLGSVAQAYYRPSMEEILEEWGKAEKALTIFGNTNISEKLLIQERLREIEEALETIEKLKTQITRHQP